jgi:membrane protease YdiL (CAAX protease family)
VFADAEVKLTTWQEAWLSLESYWCVAGGAGILAALVFFRYPQLGRRLLPLQRMRWGGWTGGEVFLAFLFWNLTQVLVIKLFQKSGFFLLIYEGEPDLVRIFLWTQVFLLPLALALIFTALNLTSRTYPSDLGLSKSRWPANFLLGYLGFVVTTPLMLGLLALLKVLSTKREPHVLEKLAATSMTWWEGVLLILMVSVVVPITEELLFRGVLQGWLRRATLPGHLVFMGTIWTISLMYAVPRNINDEDQADWSNLQWLRIFFTTVLVASYTGVLQLYKLKNLFQLESDFLPARPPGEELTQDEDMDEEEEDRDEEKIQTPAYREARARWQAQDQLQQRHKTGLAVFGSAIFFALFHPTWPDPIPLFLLGLVLGWLAQRTQNLVPGIVLHSLFNLVAALTLLFLSQVARPTNGNDDTIACRPSLVGSTINAVPGSWLPRLK